MNEPIFPTNVDATPLNEAADEALEAADHGRLFVAGFLFRGQHEVALIRKNKPEWQRGKLNGIGGKVEIGETPRAAMRREFNEEAGLDVSDWRPYCMLAAADESYGVLFFTAEVPAGAELRSLTDERVSWVPPSILEFGATMAIPNLKWLIPLARDPDRLETFVIAPAEVTA